MSNQERRHVPLCRPSIDSAAIAAVTDVLRSGWLAHGEYNERFEDAFARFIGVRHAIAMNSCTSALEVALRVADIRGEVVAPSFTWVATANAIVNAGAIPVFCDVEPQTRNVTAKLIEPCLTPRTEAIVVVHYGGQPCPMDDIVDLCRRHSLLLIEDSAETLGATWRGQQTGSFGIGCFSFFPTKNITTGEGGMLTCQDDAFARMVRPLISHGIRGTTLERSGQNQPWKRDAEMAGYNYRMPNPLAALGFCQLLRVSELNERRVQLAERYNQMLHPVTSLVPPSVSDHATHVYQMYTIQVPSDRRDAIVGELRENGVDASVHFDPPVHQQHFYRNHPQRRRSQPVQLPNTERLSQTLISLPMYPDMTEADQDWVVRCVRNALPTAGDCPLRHAG